MNDELARKLTWEEQKAATEAAIQQKLGDCTSEAFLTAARSVGDLVAEEHDLATWYTEAFDSAVARLNTDYSTSTALASAARTDVRTSEPEKFARFRELEKMVTHHNAVHQQIANAAHAGVIESTLRQRSYS